jgi:hypothetical protein
MKVVVIGGSGLIGSRVVRKLRERGHEAIDGSPKSGVIAPGDHIQRDGTEDHESGSCRSAQKKNAKPVAGPEKQPDYWKLPHYDVRTCSQTGRSPPRTATSGVRHRLGVFESFTCGANRWTLP